MADEIPKKLPQEDLDHILTHTASLWETQRNTRLFITGGTGFFGHWLVESFCWCNDRLSLGCQATILTRDPEKFAAKSPHIAGHPAITLHRGDINVSSFTEYPEGTFDTLIHAAVDSSAAPDKISSSITDGLPDLFTFAASRNLRRLLFTSSGAVYGVQPPKVSHIAEDFLGVSGRTQYGRGKFIAESLFLDLAAIHERPVAIARCFAFVGPHLPLDANFAIGNFIGDVLAGRDITIQGDGTPLRSYLYASDMAIWLWTILFKAEGGTVYNVGSPEAHSIAQIAHAVSDVAATFGVKTSVRVLQPPAPGPPARYIPSVEKAKRELNLAPTVGLHDAIARTLRWHGLKSSR